MLRYGSGRTASTTTTTTTTEDSPESSSERRIRRLRLTLHAGDNGNKQGKAANSDTAEKERDVSATWKKKNGMIQRERPAGRESPQQQLGDMTNGAPETSLQHHGPKVYGIVQRTGSDRQQEVMAREWTVNHLQDEMRYIREVRDSLEKVRERMYGQFGGMQQSMQKLSQEIRAANSQRRSLESEVRIRTQAMESFDQMNSSLISANIGLQKSLLENCQNRVDKRDEVKTLRDTYDKAQEKLRERERELAAAQAENETLRLQVESSREASTQALQELSAKLQREYEEKLQEEQRKHREEIENLQAQLDEYIKRLEEAERNIRTAEAKIAERDERIGDLERLLDCMGKEKSHLSLKLQDTEQRLRLLELTDQTDANVAKRSKELQSEAADLRERIKHLNDMVFCQQRKVKGMIEEVSSLRSQVAQKDMFISELLDRIAIVECENNELEDKLKYFMSTQNRPVDVLDTSDIGVGCNLPRREAHRNDVEPPDQNEPSYQPPIRYQPTQLSPLIELPSSTQLPSITELSSPPPPSSPTQPWSPPPPSSPTQPWSPPAPSSPTQPWSPPPPSSPTQPWSPPAPSSPTQLWSPPPPSSPTQHPSPPSSPTQPRSPSSSPTQPLPPVTSSSPTDPPFFPKPLFPTQSPQSPTQTQSFPPFLSSSSREPPSPTSPIQHPSVYLTSPITPRTFRANNPPPSRLESSLLRYTPVQYSRFLESNPTVSPFLYDRPSESEPQESPDLSRDEVDAKTNSDTLSSEESSLSSLRPRSRAPQAYTPFMKLMEITSKINIERS